MLPPGLPIAGCSLEENDLGDVPHHFDSRAYHIHDALKTSREDEANRRPDDEGIRDADKEQLSCGSLSCQANGVLR
jgi:hypothetical protein